MKIKTIIFLCHFLLALTLSVQAQSRNASIDVGLDLMTRFVWRGMSLSTSPVIQPYLEYNKGNLIIGSWASYTFAKEPYQELDMYVSYSVGSFTLTLNDYFSPVDSLFTTHNYFDWSKGSTSHALEAILQVGDFQNLPMSFTAAVMLYGNDLDENGDNYFSTYLELGYDFSIGEQAVQAFVGLTPKESLYSDQLNVVNLGIALSKELPVTDLLSLPLLASLSINPDNETVHFVAGLSF
ncbi:hypothetical protein [Carboxylicivirga sp. RSCT41]|uniref:hypothetical protein n=1 Tax=Carboxylicivirga agarovorans TaxID=3417570 RepID=UPI003D3290D1